MPIGYLGASTGAATALAAATRTAVEIVAPVLELNHAAVERRRCCPWPRTEAPGALDAVIDLRAGGWSST